MSESKLSELAHGLHCDADRVVEANALKGRESSLRTPDLAQKLRALEKNELTHDRHVAEAQAEACLTAPLP